MWESRRGRPPPVPDTASRIGAHTGIKSIYITSQTRDCADVYYTHAFLQRQMSINAHLIGTVCCIRLLYTFVVYVC